MPINNTTRVLQYFDFAKKVYGTGGIGNNSIPLPTDNASIVTVRDFRATSNQWRVQVLRGRRAI
jgi:hypothetical protein